MKKKKIEKTESMALLEGIYDPRIIKSLRKHNNPLICDKCHKYLLIKEGGCNCPPSPEPDYCECCGRPYDE